MEVARIAGVSHTTVSRFVNRNGKVNLETAEKIQAAMNKLGYVPKPPHLRRGPTTNTCRDFKSKNIAFLSVSQSTRVFSTSPFLIDLVHGIEEAASDNGLSFFQGVLRADKALPAFIARGEVDGLIIYSGVENMPPESIDALRRYPIVFVLSGRDRFFLGDRVMCNHEQIGKIAAEYLIAKGHRHVVFFDLKESNNYQQELFRGRWNHFKEICTLHDVEAERMELPLTSEETLFGGGKAQKVLTEAVRRFFVPNSNQATGVFVLFDSLTAVLYPVLQACGVKIGKDIDIISCNNEISLLVGLHPRPATIDLQPELIGKRAFERLCYRIQHSRDESRVTLEILPKLVEGGQTK